MKETINFIRDNYDNILIILTAIYEILVRRFPTSKNLSILDNVVKLFSFFAPNRSTEKTVLRDKNGFLIKETNKHILTIVFLFVFTSLSFGQLNYNGKSFNSYNTDSTTIRYNTNQLQTAYGNVGSFYYNRQSSKWRIYQDSVWYDLVNTTGGGGVYTSNNGITLTASNFQLGGSLVTPTTITGSSTNTLKYVFPSLGTTQTNGAGNWLSNTTSATLGNTQISPSITYEGQGWKTDATAASQSVKISAWVEPVEGTYQPFYNFNWKYSTNGGAYTSIMKFQYSDFVTSLNGMGSIYFGQENGQSSTTGLHNTMIGHHSARVLTTGQQNTSVGHRSGVSLTTGNQNTFLGQGAGYSWDTQSQNIAVGFHAGLNAYGTSNTYVGTLSGQSSGTVASNTGSDNTSLGWSALGGASFTSAIRNTSIGSQTGLAITTGSNNNMLGFQAGTAITTGGQNVLIGNESGKAITTANYNTMVGYQTGRTTTGQGNTVMGAASGAVITSGTFNTAIGYSAGSTTTTGSNNIAIGQNVNNSSATVSNELNIGNVIKATGMNVPSTSVINLAGLAGTGTRMVTASSTGDLSSATLPAPAGSNTQIQFNNSGAFGASASLLWDGTAININNSLYSSTSLQSIGNYQVTPVTISSASAGYNMSLSAGANSGAGNGGNFAIQSGSANGGGTPGNISMTIQNDAATITRPSIGTLTITGSNTSTSTGENITIVAGSPSTGNNNGGTITLTPGTQSGSGTAGDIIINITRTSCAGAPSKSLAIVAGTLTICP